MVDTPNTPEDFENMTDEDFLKLDQGDYSGDVPEGETSLTSEDLHAQNEQEAQANEPDEDEDGENVDPNQSPAVDPDADDAGTGDDPNASKEGEEDPDQGGTGIDPMAEASDEKPEAKTDDGTPKTDKQPEPNAKEEGKETPNSKAAGDGKPVKVEKFKLPEGMTSEQATSALAFYTQVTASFKADGKDFTVRSAEDAIRLMQQGVNYSRRMQDLKPMKAMNRLLTDHGLNDPAKMSFLIDVAKGDKEAITKLLKDNNLDPMDLDVSAETGYQAKSYAGNPQDNAFRDALDNMTTTPDGQALVSDIHGTWDDESKAKLREKPAILGNLLELKQSGVYQRVNDELVYQRSMGYLTHTPYLEAFDQVGEAMKNAGLFDESKNTPAPTANPIGQLQNNTQPQGQPLASGARKATPAKKASPNPHLSSAPPTKQANVSQETNPDFDKLNDEDFLKIAPPS